MRIVLGIALALACDPAAAETVLRVLDGDTLEVEGPRIVRLAGLLAPKEDEPGAEAARDGLSRLVSGKTVNLEPENPGIDRHGRLVAHAWLGDGTWVQGALLDQGLVRVQTLPDACSRAIDMLAREMDARKERRGLWSDEAYRLRSPEPGPLLKMAGSFQIVEGRIVSAAKVKGTVYLNFDEDWRTDFTATIGREALKRFKAAEQDPLKLKGHLVRVRGWLARQNGPAIALSHLEQIEIIE